MTNQTPTPTKQPAVAQADPAASVDPAAFATLQAQLAAMQAQFADLQSALALHAATGALPRVNRPQGERVPTCIEGGDRHPVTRTFTQRKREGSNQTTQLLRKCDSCMKEWVVVDYGA